MSLVAIICFVYADVYLGRKNTVAEVASTLSDPPTLDAFISEVAVEIPAKWRMVGILLGVSSSKLDGFDQLHRGQQMLCFESVFQLWKQEEGPEVFTWSKLFKVLEGEVIGEKRLAHSLRQKFVRL